MAMMESAWSSTNVSNKLEDCTSSKDREARSVALEKAYVHDVYEQIGSHFNDPRHRVWPRVKQFLLDLEPGSVVCDVGCGNGKYLDVNPTIYKIGLDRCSSLANIARDKDHEVLVCDNLTLPFRDECFDAVLSVAVIHHFATLERRVEALKELSRVLRIGGKLMVSVWAMEQRHRKFESQDVLVPWNKPALFSSDDKTSSIERDLNSTTTTTSDDDVTHYNAYTQTSDSDSFPSLRRECRRRTGRVRHRGRSIDPNYPSSSHSSSDLSSPNESCYSFVRRALQKLAGTKRNRGGRAPWFLQGFEEAHDEVNEPLASGNDELLDNNQDDFMPIELRQLESTEFAELLHLNDPRHNGLYFSNALNPRRRRTLETTCGLHSTDSVHVQPKSKSLSDLLGLIPIGIFRGSKNPLEQLKRSYVATYNGSSFNKSLASQSSLSEIMSPSTQFPDFVRHKAVQTDSVESLDISRSSDSKITIKLDSDSFTSHIGGSSVPSSILTPCNNFDSDKDKPPNRPMLVKQKQSFGSTSFTAYQCSVENEKKPTESLKTIDDECMSENNNDVPNSLNGSSSDAAARISSPCWKDIKQSVKNLPDFKSNKQMLQQPQKSLRVTPGLSSIWKQTSLNEELIFSERLKEKEKLKQNIQKQCSLNEELIYERRETTRWDQMKEAFFSHSNVKRIQLFKNNFSHRFRSSETENQGTGSGYEQFPSSGNVRQSAQAGSLRNGFVRMLRNWKTTDERDESGDYTSNGMGNSGPRHGSKAGGIRRGLFQPFFLRRSSAGSLNVNKKDDGNTTLSPLTSPPYLKRRPSENELGHELLVNGSGKLIPGVRHVRKLSREEGSDSSKDSSFQSDTSVDSEDSFASVIFIPKGNSAENSALPGNDNLFFSSETRANSTDSDRSPKSPASKLSSPPNYNVPKITSPLASELTRRKSPEVSPTRFTTFPEATREFPSKFVFDETATVPTKEKGTSDLSPGIPQINTILVPSALSVEVKLQSESEPSEIVRHKTKNRGEKSEKIVVLRKPGIQPASKTILTRQQVRRSLPKELALELFNPETDDVDTSDTSSSSPNSVSSVVSVVNDDNIRIAEESSFHSVTEAEQKDLPEISLEKSVQVVLESEKVQHFFEPSNKLPVLVESDNEKNDDEITEGITQQTVKGFSSPSFENLIANASPKSRRKAAVSRFGNTSEWLQSLPQDVASEQTKRMNSEKRSGEKMLFGEVKKFQQKGPDAKWPSSITDDSPPAAKSVDEEHQQGTSYDTASHSSTDSVPPVRNTDELEEKDSLFDSIENLTNKQQPSRNPSLDSSLRMSSTCSCSIRGGDSFDSWTSAKSSLTNCSSTQHKSSFPSLITLPFNSNSKPGSSLSSDRTKRPDSAKTWSAGTEESEDSAVLTYHRYYHVFSEGELDKLIEKYVQNLHVISSYYDHANWCIIAEKVQVWTI